MQVEVNVLMAYFIVFYSNGDFYASWRFNLFSFR